MKRHKPSGVAMAHSHDVGRASVYCVPQQRRPLFIRPCSPANFSGLMCVSPWCQWDECDTGGIKVVDCFLSWEGQWRSDWGQKSRLLKQHANATSAPKAAPKHGPDEQARWWSLAGVSTRLSALRDVVCVSHFPASAAVTHVVRLGREDAGRLREPGRSPPPLMSPPAPPGQLASINVIAQMCEGDGGH